MTTIKYIKPHFAHYGIPKEVISDNGPQLSSKDFQESNTEIMDSSIPHHHRGTPYLTDWWRETTRQKGSKPYSARST